MQQVQAYLTHRNQYQHNKWQALYSLLSSTSSLLVRAATTHNNHHVSIEFGKLLSMTTVIFPDQE